jgi:CRP-like cAMP-binding protein
MSVFYDNPWFSSLAPADAEALLAVATRHRLGRGEMLFQQGQAADQPHGAFFAVESGSLRYSSLHVEGSEGILAVIEPGNWIGEVALLEDLPRAQTAIAQEETQVRAVSAAAFHTLMERPSFAKAVARLLAGRLRLAMSFIGESALPSTRERVARRLLVLAHGDTSLSTTANNTISASQDMLAMMLGISRPTMNKELRALEQAGAIALHYGRIEIKDSALLLGE